MKSIAVKKLHRVSRRMTQCFIVYYFSDKFKNNLNRITNYQMDPYFCIKT